MRTVFVILILLYPVLIVADFMIELVRQRDFVCLLGFGLWLLVCLALLALTTVRVMGGY